jgi:predicted RNase H-like nuclease
VRFLGVDLAWGEGSETRDARDSGVLALSESGEVIDANWTRGLDATLEWIQGLAIDDTLLFIDAPLVVLNPSGQRLCERQVGQRYGRWFVSANSTNLASPRLAGVALRRRLEELGWRYDDGRSGPPDSGRVMSECYPYTTLVGVEELGYDLRRPLYKRKPRGMLVADFRPVRAAVCDDLISRLARLQVPGAPLNLTTHPETRSLYEQHSPHLDRPYKRGEDLIDAAICAWTAALWFRFGVERCQVLGLQPNGEDLQATIIAPCRIGQRLP